MSKPCDFGDCQCNPNKCSDRECREMMEPHRRDSMGPACRVYFMADDYFKIVLYVQRAGGRLLVSDELSLRGKGKNPIQRKHMCLAWLRRKGFDV